VTLKHAARLDFLRIMGLCASPFARPVDQVSLAWAACPKARVNIALIMADDLGCECLGCYGGALYEAPMPTS